MFLLYGENQGLKKDIKKFIIEEIEGKNGNVEKISLYENEILKDSENFYNFIYYFTFSKIITLYLI